MMSTMQTVRPSALWMHTAARKAGVVRAEPEQVPQKVAEVAETVQADAKMAAQAAEVKAEGLTADVKDTLKPRVNELKRQQLTQGTTDVGAIMSFGGPAPELINGRLAMLAFVAALGAEFTTHETVGQQLGEAQGPVLITTLLIIAATIVPIVRGSAITDDGAGEGVKPGSFNLTNELINGRAAMLGFAIMVVYEAITKIPLFTLNF